MIPKVTHQARECTRDGCTNRYNPRLRETGTPPAFCSIECWQDQKNALRPAPKRRAQMPRTTGVKKRKAISEASPAQRKATADRACVYCAKHAGSCHPAHLVPKGLVHDGEGDPRATIPLCPEHHRLFDSGELDLLPHLEPHWREQLAYAVERFGLLPTLRRVTNQRWVAVDEREAA